MKYAFKNNKDIQVFRNEVIYRKPEKVNIWLNEILYIQIFLACLL